MNQLILLLSFGVLLLAIFAGALLVRAFRAARGTDSFSVTEISTVLALPGLNFPNAPLLFSRSDYELLCSAPSLTCLARELSRERTRLVRLWLRLLGKDVLTLWRFRRFLVRHGAPAGVVEELGVAAAALSMLVSLTLLRVGVSIVGPFVLVELLRGTPRLAGSIQHVCARALASLPQGRLAQVREAWSNP